MKKIVILGGGTAGWLTAHFCKQHFKSSEITLIESSEIGILGAGEGTTPHMPDFLESIGIDITQLFKHTSATVKNGIMFTNWNGDGTSFFHPFYDELSLLESPYFVGKSISEGKDLNTLVPSYFFSKYNKVKFYRTGERSFSTWGCSAIHFDARKLAEFLKTKGVERGVKVIDSKLSDLEGDAENISKLYLENGTTVECDFVFDCSGFKRLLIGGHFKSEWVSYKDSIPNNKAIPFFLSQGNDDPIPPYTEAIAMKHGWVWKIPVQGRYGCGYVFDSRCASDEEIKNEIYEKFGQVETPRSFNFEPGSYKEVWKGNCIAVGLSSGFIEPLEATSLWVALSTLQSLVNNVTGMLSNNENAKKALNKLVYKMNEQVLAFIYFHYITKKADTEYWSKFKENNKEPYFYKKIDSIRDYINYSDMAFLPNSFGKDNILAVGAGGYFFTKDAGEKLKQTVEFKGQKDFAKNYSINTAKIHDQIIRSFDHREFINFIKTL